MSLRALLTGMAYSSCVVAHAGGDLALAKDYYSVQIASAKDPAALASLFERYADLPFVRIERRGSVFTLRAGFWPDAATAKQATAQAGTDQGFLRVAVFKPEAIVKRNWEDVESVSQAASPVMAINEALPTDRKPELPTSKPATVDAAPLPREVDPRRGAAPDLLKPFDQSDYALAFDVFLGAGDQERAFRIAEKAVGAVPLNTEWRLKLAQVSEWTHRPTQAAEQWEWMFTHGDQSPATVSNVIRLAPLLSSPLVALQAWEVRAKRAPLARESWNDIFWLYESASEPSRGSEFFEARFRQTQIPLLLEYAARLAENSGDDTRALGLYLKRVELKPTSMDLLLHLVLMFIRIDEMGQALALMQAHQSEIPPEDIEFWRLLGQVGWSQRDYASAEKAYQQVSVSTESTSADWSRLIFLVRQKHPAAAAGLALEAFQRFGAPDQLQLSLELYAEVGDDQAQARIFNSLDPKALAVVERNLRFLLLRSQYHRHQKAPDRAWNDLQMAQNLAPKDPDVVLSTLWFLIDEKRTSDLSFALKRYQSANLTDDRFWLPLAAANQSLGRTRESIYWYRRALASKTDDPLLLLNYADALETSQNVGMAARVRRHAWLLLKKQRPATGESQSLDGAPDLLALARLSLLDQPGDPGLRLVRELVTRLREQTPDPQATSQWNALVLGWGILKEQYPNARTWMLRRYGQQLQTTPPVWGQAQVALQLGDTEEMQRLLRAKDKDLPIYNHYDMAYALGHVQEALDVSFHGMSQGFGDEPLYDRFRQHAPLQANYVQVRLGNDDLGALSSRGFQMEARLNPLPGLQTILGWSRATQSSDDLFLSPLAKEVDSLASLETLWTSSLGQSSLTLLQKQEWQRYTGLRFRQSTQLGGRLSIELGGDYHSESTASLPLRLAGYENRLYSSVNYALGRREYLRVAPQVTQYYTQNGDFLGSGRALDLEAGYRIRVDYPDWRARALVSYQGFNPGSSLGADALARLPADFQASIASGQIDSISYFIPEGSTTFGACLSMGENLAGQSLQTTYSRAWRPFMDVCLRHNTVAGSGYTGTLGVAGSLTGEDHVSLQWQKSDGTVPGSDASRTLSLRYRHYF